MTRATTNRRTLSSRAGAAAAALALLTAACGGDDDAAGAAETSDTSEAAAASDSTGADGEDASADAELPTVVVTTNILGDVVGEVLGDHAEVVTIMPVGSDPHDFQASAQQANAIREADVLVVNGGGFEEGLLDVIAGAEEDGVLTFAALDAVDTIAAGEGGHAHGDDDEHGDEDEHGDDDHGDDEHGDEPAGDEDHGDEGGADPHFFTDPLRMAEATEALVDVLVAEVDGLDAAAVEVSADAYLAELADLDATITSTLAALEPADRVLVTNHEVFGYFADRYDFEVVGTIIPSATTSDAVSPADLAALADTVRDEGVAAVFSDTSASDELAETLATEVGGVAVVRLFSESLGEDGSGGATYLEMMRSNAERIAAGLAP